jgi:hypothetical protein
MRQKLNDFQKEGPIMGTELKAADFVSVGDSTGDIVSLGEIAGLHTNTQLVLDPIHKQNIAPGGCWGTRFPEPKLLIICDPASSEPSFSSQAYIIHVFKVFMSLVRPFF